MDMLTPQWRKSTRSGDTLRVDPAAWKAFVGSAKQH
ncbi:DUF397 domain-containing protein [Micromonospora sp. NPDC049044]